MRLSRLLLITCLIVVYCSCKKNSGVTFTPSLYFLNGDTANKNLVLFSSSDTLSFNITVSSTYLLTRSAHIQIGVDDNARNNYNTAAGTNYLAMPDGAYTFKDTSTVYDTSIYAIIPVTIYKKALDLTKQYMLAFSIVNSDGVSITSGESTIYFHTVTNTLAGLYNSTGVKISYNGDAADGNINSIDSFSVAKSLIPITSTTSQLDYADLGSNGWQYSLSLSPDDPQTLNVMPNLVLTSAIQNGSFKILSSSFNPDTKAVYIKSSYKNTSGNERVIEESLNLR